MTQAVGESVTSQESGVAVFSGNIGRDLLTIRVPIADEAAVFWLAEAMNDWHTYKDAALQH
jgi:hypothetical protein